MKIDKNAVVTALRELLAGQLERLTLAQKTVQEGAVHPESRQEGSKDMRSTEASYLARGLAERVETLRDGLRALDLLRVEHLDDEAPAAVGALVTLVDDEGEESLYFLAPAGGGEMLNVGGRTILVLTPRSPLGAAIAGQRAGDSVVAELPAGLLHAEIDHIA